MSNFNVWTEKTAVGNFRVRHRNEDGTQKTDYCVDKNERLQIDGKWHTAPAICKQLEAKVLEKYRLKELGQHDLSITVERTGAAFIAEAISNNRSEQTIRNYETAIRYISEQGGMVHLEDLTHEKIRDWKLAMINDGYAKSTIVLRLVVLATFLNWLVTNGYLVQSPFGKKMLPTLKGLEPRFWTLAQFKSFDEATKFDADLRLACNLAYGAGLRAVECAGDRFGRPGVQYEDLRWRPDGKVHLVLRKEVVKGQKNSRMVRLDSDIVVLLGSRQVGPLIRISRTDIDNRFKKARTLSMIDPELTFHGLRHSFSKNFLQGGGDLRALMYILGHKSIKTTADTYSHLEESYMMESMEIAFKRRKEAETLLNTGKIPLEAEGRMRGGTPKNDELSRTVANHNAPSDDAINEAKNQQKA